MVKKSYWLARQTNRFRLIHISSIFLALTIFIGEVQAQQREEKLKPLLKDAVFALSNVMMHDVVSPVIASRYYMYCTIGSNAINASHGRTIHPSLYIRHFPKSMGANDLKDPSLAALFCIYETGMAILPSGMDMQSEYESVKYWEPTLVCNNGYFYIASLNEVLHDTIKDIPLTNDLVMVADYVQYGITVSESVIEHFIDIEDPMKLALAVSYRVECEIRDIDSVIKWLSELGCDGLTEPSKVSSKQLFFLNESAEKLLDNLNMDIIRDQSNLKSYEKPVIIQYRTYGFNEHPGF